jgi:hypothetical protein
MDVGEYAHDLNVALKIGVRFLLCAKRKKRGCAQQQVTTGNLHNSFDV